MLMMEGLGTNLVAHHPDAPEPPWIIFPNIKPDKLAAHVQQGISEPWFDRVWRPFWTPLTSRQQDRYLDDWQASPEWREAIVFVFDSFSDLDVDQDARESEEYLRTLGKTTQEKKRSFLSRLLRRR